MVFKIKKTKRNRFIVFEITNNNGRKTSDIRGNFATRKEAQNFIRDQ